MVFIPMGLKSKVKDPPFLVAVIVVITAYVSIFNFKNLDEFYKEYVHSQERQKYYYQLRSVYVNACDAFQKPQTCDMLIKFRNDDSIRNPYVANSDAKRYLHNAEDIDSRLYSDWHSEEVMMKRLVQKQKTQEVNELRILALNNKNVMSALHNKYDLFSKQNPTPLALLKAQFTHSDWFHLLGNLVFFLFFGACLEQAMGRTWVFGIYFVGGTLGLATQLMLSESHSVFILGASANIFACAGAFLRLYWKQPLQLLFSFFFVLNRTIRLPTWSFFLFFVIIQQISGLTSQEGGGVAYMAHIVGLAFGFAAAHVWSKKNNFVTTSHLIFPYEKTMIATADNLLVCKEKFNALIDVIFYAPSNSEAYQKFYLTYKSCSCEPHCLSSGSQQFFARQSSILIKDLFLEKNLGEVAEIYNLSIDMGCDPKVVIQELIAEDVMHLGNQLYKDQNIAALKNLFSAATQVFSNEQKIAFQQFLDSLLKEKGDEYAS
ncbi:MAG: rhomboid family intramembrane serine protease [Bdellovibrionaceae bacterium]|nr:rhomboid family intramembrane serine protease [Pseudobdellovibrionaceae bacterium]